MKVTLIGVGLGNKDTLTIGAEKAIATAELLIGAPRLLKGYEHKTCLPLIAASDIAKAIHESSVEHIAVLLSGDIGFYSGAKNLYPLLTDCEVVSLPGISSVVYFCAKCQTTWQDAYLVSAHGREHNAPGAAQSHPKTFALLGSTYTAADFIRDLVEWGMGEVTVTIGERLSYEDETITKGYAKDLLGREFDVLAVALIENPHPIVRAYNAPSLSDTAFLRDKVPMTKEEIRLLSVCKLKLLPHHTVWDVGAGTGSVSIECAYGVPEGRVFAVERKDEAVALLEKNKASMGLTNLHSIKGLAPEALHTLPAPDRVFLGGTAGNMEEILRVALEKNPAVRIVVTAVTLETIAETVRCFDALSLTNIDMVQLSATRTRQAGSYHLMDAQNPVWVMSGEGSL